MRGQCNADNAPPYLNHGSFNSGGAAIGLVLVFDKGVWSCYMHPQYIYAKYMLAIRYTHYSNPSLYVNSLAWHLAASTYRSVLILAVAYILAYRAYSAHST